MIPSKSPNIFVPKLGIVVHYHEPECHAKRLVCNFQGQDHNEGSKLYRFYIILYVSYIFCATDLLATKLDVLSYY